jgi:hypothetical protein
MANDAAYVRDYLNQGMTPSQAFQAAIDYMFTNWGGGPVIAPPGKFVFDHTVTHKGGVIVRGAGRRGGTTITSNGVDMPLWQFDNTCGLAGLYDVWFIGLQDRAAQQHVVTIAENMPVYMERVDIWGGNSALFNLGCDCRIRDCFISGNGLASVLTQGANFYDHCKFDTVDDLKSPQFSVYIAGPTQTLIDAGAMENFFNFCDMSGKWQSGSIYVDDRTSPIGPIGTNQFIGGVMSGAVILQRQKQSIFSGVRFGSSSFVNNGGSVSVGTCTALVPLILPTSVERGTGNINIGGGTFG